MKTNKETIIQSAIDRIENGIAVLELPDDTTIEINTKFLPKSAKEGKVLDIIFRINEEEENKRLKEIEDLQNELLNRNK